MKLNRLVALVVALCLMLGCTAIAEQFPLVDEPTTLHIMAQVGSYYPDQKLDNVHGLQKYEEMSGVHIEWDNVSNSVFGDTLAARIADSGTKLPDIILRGKIGNDKLASWGEQGIIVDLRPYLEENAPNFWKLFNEESTISGAIVGANGEIWGLPQVILGAEMRTPTKLWLNKNAMEAIGMDDPKTLDDYVKVMTAIRDSDWNGNGENDEITTIASANNMHNYFYGSFGLRTRGAHHDVVDVDPETGELRVYFQHENFRKYVEFMTMMYQEKLIYQEIFTEGDKQSDVFNQTNRLSMLLNTIAPGNGGDNWYTFEVNGEDVLHHKITGSWTGPVVLGGSDTPVADSGKHFDEEDSASSGSAGGDESDGASVKAEQQTLRHMKPVEGLRDYVTLPLDRRPVERVRFR